MTDHAIIFGVRVAAESYEGNTLRIKFVDASEEFFSISPIKIMLGGFPVSVYSNNNGKNVLGVYVVPTDSSIFNYNELDYANVFHYKGSKFYYKSSGEYSIWAFEQVENGSVHHEHDIPWRGAMLSLNPSRELLCHVKTGIPDEVQVASVGGIPMPFVRFEEAWHLSILDDSGE